MLQQIEEQLTKLKVSEKTITNLQNPYIHPFSNNKEDRPTGLIKSQILLSKIEIQLSEMGVPIKNITTIKQKQEEKPSQKESKIPYKKYQHKALKIKPQDPPQEDPTPICEIPQTNLQEQNRNTNKIISPKKLSRTTGFYCRQLGHTSANCETRINKTNINDKRHRRKDERKLKKLKKYAKKNNLQISDLINPKENLTNPSEMNNLNNQSQNIDHQPKDENLPLEPTPNIYQHPSLMHLSRISPLFALEVKSRLEHHQSHTHHNEILKVLLKFYLLSYISNQIS